nr:C4-type zinc ribbon domain-containing protein [Geobacter sp.]
MQKNMLMLEELQALDLKIDGRHAERQALLGKLAELDGQVEESQHAVEEKRGELAMLEEERQALEANLAAENDNIERSEARQREIKTQKEYQAVVKEVSAARKLKAELEEQILQKSAQIEELAADVASREADLGSLVENMASRKAEVQADLDRLDQEIAAEAATKASTAKAIPPSLLKRYEALRERRQGIAVVEARAGNCAGCNMNLPPQLYNSLFRGGDLVLCPHCQRMLVVHPEE